MTTTVPFGINQTFPTFATPGAFGTFGAFGAPTFPFAGFTPNFTAAFAGQPFGYTTGATPTTSTIPGATPTATQTWNGATDTAATTGTPIATGFNTPVNGFTGFTGFNGFGGFPYGGYTPVSSFPFAGFTQPFTGGVIPSFNGYNGFTGQTPWASTPWTSTPWASTPWTSTPWTTAATTGVPFGWSPSTAWNSFGGVTPSWTPSAGFPSFFQPQNVFGSTGYNSFTGYNGVTGYPSFTAQTFGGFTAPQTYGAYGSTPWSPFAGVTASTPWATQQTPWFNTTSTPFGYTTSQPYTPWTAGYTGNTFAFPQATVSPLGFSPYSWGAFYAPTFSNWATPFSQFSPFAAAETTCDRGQRRGFGIREAA